MLYNLVFYLNLDLEISKQLSMVTVITPFHLLKVLNSLLLMNYSQSLSTNLWLTDPQYFFFDFT
jgi:hypothetical protein